MNDISDFTYPANFIKYLGTSGGRFSMIRQLRSTGGLWLRYGGLNGVIDPGPGSLVRICSAYPPLDSETIDFILLTHKHVDHSTDASVLIECMTHGKSSEKHGILIAPKDAICGSEAVIIKHFRDRVKRVVIPVDGKRIDLGTGVKAEPVPHVHHGVDCFGYIFRAEGVPEWGLISDCRMDKTLFAERYKNCDFISLNTTFADSKERIQHMSVTEANDLLKEINARRAVYTHLCPMLTGEKGELCLTERETDLSRVVAAADGDVVDLDTLEVYREIAETRPPTIYEKL